MRQGLKNIKAVQSAIQYLEMRGYQIIEQHFRRSKFNIDLIATKDLQVYFVTIVVLEEMNGGALELITAGSINNLRLAAAVWIEEEQWQKPIHFSLLELSSHSYGVINYFEDYI